MTTTKARTRNGFALLAVAAGLAIGLQTSAASAAPSPVAQAAIVEYSNGQLLLQLAGSGTNYVGVLTAGAGCTANNQTADTLKAWLSIAQASLLSGKNVLIYYNVCGGSNYIAAIDIYR